MKQTPDSPSPAGQGRYAYDGLERAIHEKARLGILTSLLAHPLGLTFTDLKELCALTDGNLNRHLKVLVEAGLIEIDKGTHGNRPQTLCRVTTLGRERFQEYLSALEQVIADAARAAARKQAPNPARWNSGLVPGSESAGA
ncbi:MAG: ArsR family transcriptional regulator [Planctomycetaceae bacterium]|nr:MAG: ArsR family transcriptional regulator [Planctomycetaceae bacterium]